MKIARLIFKKIDVRGNLSSKISTDLLSSDVAEICREKELKQMEESVSSLSCLVWVIGYSGNTNKHWSKREGMCFEDINNGNEDKHYSDSP